MHSAPDVGDDEEEGGAAPVAAEPKTRVDKLARIVVLVREAKAIAEGLSRPSADEADAAALLAQIEELLTTSPTG
jgi:hypothetical protein